MNDVGAVDVLKTLQELIDDIALVNVLQNASTNNSMKIGL